jgi:hypothetical protein
MKLSQALSISIMMFSVPALFAATPPVIPAARLQRPIPAAANHAQPAPITKGIPVTPFTLQTLQSSHLSGVVYSGVLAGLTGHNVSTAVTTTSRRSAVTAGRSTAPGRLTPIADATVQSPSINASADSLQDVEPYVVSITAGGVDRTVSSYIKYESANVPKIHYASTTDFSTFTRGTMPMPGGYSLSGDPFMDENPYSGGVAPDRTYCVGIAFNDIFNPQNAPNAIAVWHSDPSDNGNFTAAATIADNRGAGYFLDKPAMAVSWHNSTDLGYVYLAYVSYDYVNSNSAIVVARSTDGGASFPQKTVIAYGPNSAAAVANPQVVVAPGTGYVYVLWVDFGLNQIQMARSTDFGATFGAHEVAASGTMSTGNLHGGIRAETIPMARFNSTANSVDVVWHDNGANGTEVEYAYKDTTGWHRPSLPVTQFTANDQFMPAIDFNGAGNIVITYYDRHADPTNTAYRAYEAYLTAQGSRIDANDNWMGGFDSTASGANTFIGDYQSVWDWTFAAGEKATGSWIGVVSSVYDNWLTRISY